MIVDVFMEDSCCNWTLQFDFVFTFCWRMDITEELDSLATKDDLIKTWSQDIKDEIKGILMKKCVNAAKGLLNSREK